MATKYIRIGSMINCHAYDDGDFDEAIETDQPIAAGDPVDPDHVVTLKSQRLRAVTVTSISTPGELNTEPGTDGDLILAVQVNSGGIDDFTIYAYDAAGPSINVPFVVDAPGTGTERWIAILGRYSVLTDMISLGTFLCSELFVGTPSISLKLAWTSELVSRILTFNVDGANRTLKLKSDVTINQNLETTSNVRFNTVNCQGNQVLTAQQASIADAATVTGLTLNTGSDQVDRAAFNTALTTLVSEINGIKSQLNELLAKVRIHGIIAT